MCINVPTSHNIVSIIYMVGSFQGTSSGQVSHILRIQTTNLQSCLITWNSSISQLRKHQIRWKLSSAHSSTPCLSLSPWKISWMMRLNIVSGSPSSHALRVCSQNSSYCSKSDDIRIIIDCVAIAIFEYKVSNEFLNVLSYLTIVLFENRSNRRRTIWKIDMHLYLERGWNIII